MYNRKQVVLFLCTRNSCRSQMAEALLRRHAGDRYEVISAGMEPSDAIHPLAEQVMNEIGVSLDGQTPKCVKLYMGKVPVTHAIIVCQEAEELCPRLYPGSYDKLVWPFDDPVTFVGSPIAELEKFRTVRDEIDQRIREWLQEQEALCLTN